MLRPLWGEGVELHPVLPNIMCEICGKAGNLSQVLSSSERGN